MWLEKKSVTSPGQDLELTQKESEKDSSVDWMGVSAHIGRSHTYKRDIFDWLLRLAMWSFVRGFAALEWILLFTSGQNDTYDKIQTVGSSRRDPLQIVPRPYKMNKCIRSLTREKKTRNKDDPAKQWKSRDNSRLRRRSCLQELCFAPHSWKWPDLQTREVHCYSRTAAPACDLEKSYYREICFNRVFFALRRPTNPEIFRTFQGVTLERKVDASWSEKWQNWRLPVQQILLAGIFRNMVCLSGIIWLVEQTPPSTTGSV